MRGTWSQHKDMTGELHQVSFFPDADHEEIGGTVNVPDDRAAAILAAVLNATEAEPSEGES